nr:hypothetical protein [uncultured Pseudomonas sp.]
MSLSRLAPLTAAQDGDALELLDRAFADDPSLAWYLHADRPDYAARRRVYLASYQRFHRANRLMTQAVEKCRRGRQDKAKTAEKAEFTCCK